MSAADVRVGDTVLVNKKYKAVVRFIGPTAFKSGIWYGVELEREKGKHNGTVRGRVVHSFAGLCTFHVPAPLCLTCLCASLEHWSACLLRAALPWRRTLNSLFTCLPACLPAFPAFPAFRCTA